MVGDGVSGDLESCSSEGGVNVACASLAGEQARKDLLYVGATVIHLAFQRTWSCLLLVVGKVFQFAEEHVVAYGGITHTENGNIVEHQTTIKGLP